MRKNKIHTRIKQVNEYSYVHNIQKIINIVLSVLSVYEEIQRLILMKNYSLCFCTIHYDNNFSIS